MKDQLIQELKEAIIEALNLEEIQPEDIDPAAPLFREGLGLDSIDALEIIILIDKKYGIKMANPAESKAVFYSVETLADFVAENRTK
ncbi:MAG: phosphopantetheine-binding protein [Alistipes sp.]